jgi:hypothetical protein
MKIILSRKGFDGENGGVPSPIFSDQTMVSLPIPKKSTLQYGQIRFNRDGLHNLGEIIEPLTGYRLSDSCCAHLDPDLNVQSLERQAGWRGIFGQSGSPQGILDKADVREGSLFLFFGQFCEVNGELRFIKRRFNTKHVILGWLRVGKVLHLPEDEKEVPEWARYHPHLNFGGIEKKPNAIYLAAESLQEQGNVPGWGLFKRYDPRLCLTRLSPDKCADKPSLWELPPWMNPWKDPLKPRKALGLHDDKNRWSGSGENAVVLQSVSRGQEFILDCADYPEAIVWAQDLIEQLA